MRPDQGPAGAAVPLGQVASVKLTRGPTTIRTENAQLVNYVYVDLHGRDLGGYVSDAQRAVAATVTMPPGYHVEWSGQFEYLERAYAVCRGRIGAGGVGCCIDPATVTNADPGHPFAF